MTKKFILTPSLFFRLEISPLWIWHDLFNDPAKKEPLSEFVLKIMEEGVLHEREFIKGLTFIEVTEKNPEKGAEMTLNHMRKGVPLIYQGWLEMKKESHIYRGRPDLLEKMPGKSDLGDWFYVPVDIKSSSKIKKVFKQQLVFYCLLLENLQGFLPKNAFIINRHHVRQSVDIDENALTFTYEAIEEILTIMQGKKPAVMISSSTKQSPWFKEDLKEAEKNQDIALIYNLRRDVVKGLRDQSIFSLSDIAKKEIDVQNIPGLSEGTLKRAKLQAESLVFRKPIWLGKAEIKEAPLKLYFDIEGDPWLNTEYLFGFWIVGDPDFKYAKFGKCRKFEKENKYFLYFLAETPEGESQMWEEFLDWIALLKEPYVVYHYSNYEPITLKILADEYEETEDLKQFLNQMVDLRKIVEKSVILPIYFYSIKDIAKWLNFGWRHEKAGGGQSIFWYEKWLESGDRQFLNDIVDYNEDDVRATEHLHLWLKKEAKANSHNN